MRRNIPYLLTILLVLSCFLAFGQQQYQAQHYGGPGTIYLYNPIQGIPPIDVTGAGANVTWDLSAYADLNTYPKQIVGVGEVLSATDFFIFCGFSTANCFSAWLNTEQALLSSDSLSLIGYTFANVERYHNKTSTQLLETFFGFTAQIGGNPTHGVIVYNNPDTLLEFPVTYGNSWTSDIDWTIDLSLIAPGTSYKADQDRTSQVDAWGTVMTPYDTFTNVVRLRSEIVHTDTLFTDSLNVPINVTLVEYMWFDTAYKLPILVATGVITDSIEIINVVDYLYEATCAIPTWDMEIAFDIYYIDTSGTVTIPFNIVNGNADEYNWDFGDGTFETTDSSVTHTYTMGGLYSVEVTGCMTNCLPLNSCNSDVVFFEIRDTFTSVDVVPGNELGIKLFPHPVIESFTVDIPVDLGSQFYTILDITGRQITNGNLTTGHSTLSAGSLETGVYFIRFRNQQGSGNRDAVMKFAVVRD